MREVEHADDHVVVLRVHLRLVRDDHDRLRIHDLVVVRVRREDLVERFLERDTFEVDRVRAVLERGFVGDVDPRRLADEVEDVAQARVVEVELQRLARRGVEERRRAEGARLLAQLLDLRPRTRGLDAFADLLLQLRDLGRGDPIGAHHLERLPVFGQRRVELVLLFQVVRASVVNARRFPFRAFELNLVLGLIGILLDRFREVCDRRVPVAGPHRLLPMTERASRRAAREENGHRDHQPDSSHYFFVPLLPSQRNRGASAAVGIFQDDRLDADFHDAVSAIDDIAFLAVEHRLAVGERRDFRAAGRIDRAEELQLNRRRPGRYYRWRRWRRSRASSRAASGAGRRRRRQRRRLRLKAERVSIRRPRLRRRLLQGLEPDGGRLRQHAAPLRRHAVSRKIRRRGGGHGRRPRVPPDQCDEGDTERHEDPRPRRLPRSAVSHRCLPGNR